MRIKGAASVLLALIVSSPATAGTTTFPATSGAGTTFRFGTDGLNNLFGNGAICDGAACAVLAAVKAANTPAVAADPALVVTLRPAGSFTFTGCAVTTSSAQCLAGSTAVNHLQIQNTSASASIACNFGGTAILNSSAGSFMLAALQPSLWGPNTAGVPSAALNCIGSASATLYIEYN